MACCARLIIYGSVDAYYNAAFTGFLIPDGFVAFIGVLKIMVLLGGKGGAPSMSLKSSTSPFL